MKLHDKKKNVLIQNVTAVFGSDDLCHRKKKGRKRRKCCIMPEACGEEGAGSVSVRGLKKKKRKKDGELFVKYILFQHLRDGKHIRNPPPEPPPG